jgi:hypothetical protein
MYAYRAIFLIAIAIAIALAGCGKKPEIPDRVVVCMTGPDYDAAERHETIEVDQAPTKSGDPDAELWTINYTVMSNGQPTSEHKIECQYDGEQTYPSTAFLDGSATDYSANVMPMMTTAGALGPGTNPRPKLAVTTFNLPD